MTHLILWTTYRVTPKTIDDEISEYDRETHELIGLLASAQAKLSIASASEFKNITPWITKVIKHSELADEALADMKGKKGDAADKVSQVNSNVMSFLKEFQAGLTKNQ
jgi:hypothetical protein